MDEDLAKIRAHRAGDPDAFAELFEKYRERIYRICYRLTFDKEDALDVCQLAFFKAYRALPVFERQGRFYTWLYRIATNVAIDFLRDRRRRPLVLDAETLEATEAQPSAHHRARSAGAARPTRGRPAAGAAPWSPQNGEPGPFEALLRKELEWEVARAVESLSPEHRATLLLRAAEGLSYRQIAAVLRCPTGTVMSRLHAARERMREALGSYIEGLSRQKLRESAVRGI